MNTVELRWLVRDAPYMNFLVGKVRVLQYRKWIEVDDESGHYWEWSEWVDVPVVEK